MNKSLRSGIYFLGQCILSVISLSKASRCEASTQQTVDFLPDTGYRCRGIPSSPSPLLQSPRCLLCLVCVRKTIKGPPLVCNDAKSDPLLFMVHSCEMLELGPTIWAKLDIMYFYPDHIKSSQFCLSLLGTILLTLQRRLVQNVGEYIFKDKQVTSLSREEKLESICISHVLAFFG